MTEWAHCQRQVAFLVIVSTNSMASCARQKCIKHGKLRHLKLTMKHIHGMGLARHNIFNNIVTEAIMISNESVNQS